MNEMLNVMWAWVTAWSHDTSRKITRDERGASAIETVLIIGGLAAIALVVLAILRAKIVGKANSIPVD